MIQVSSRNYYQTFSVLCGLTILTVGVAYIDLGPLNTVLALGIAALKALLVLVYFMHARDSSPLVWLCVATGIFWLFLLLAFPLSDVVSRGWLS